MHETGVIMSTQPPPPWAPPQHKISTPRGLWIGLAGAAAVIVGAFLPWVSVSSVFGELGVNGIDGDGKITAALAAVGGALLWFGWTKRKPRYVLGAIVVAALAGAVALLDWSNLSDKVSDLNATGTAVHASIGIGFYATGVGIIMLFASGFEVRSAARSVPRPGPDRQQ